MSPDTIGTIFTGLTGLIAGLAAFVANRNKVIGDNQKLLKAQVRTLHTQLTATVSHVFALEMQLARHGIPVPDRPAILEPDEDDDADPQPTPDTTQRRTAAPAGRHHHRQA